MSVLVETTIGSFGVTLDCKDSSVEAYNFLKLCKANYYNYQCFYDIRKGHSIEFGDGLYRFKDRKELRVHSTFINSLLNKNNVDTIVPELATCSSSVNTKEADMGRIGFKTTFKDKERLIGSKVVVALTDWDSNDGSVSFFGRVNRRNWDVLDNFNRAIIDEKNELVTDIRIIKMHILKDPFPDPEGFCEYEISLPIDEVRLPQHIIDNSVPSSSKEIQDIKKDILRKETTLEIIGDIPSVGVRPLENVLFICKLNPSTKAKDIAMIFQRFGEIKSVEIIKDKESGYSLGYGFIEFTTKHSCELAYTKMESTIIDDRRIHVDFCQSVGKLSKDWIEGKL
ncbi:hypothetical protein Kpol_2000p44 [Vanderwaltozyma polyspora DSM 70294]|uniref:Peptidyl-prolyl cis-trans isomerase n=1 Tax=Vanderwaltozyma polyspora (strain ATCC 22028 / DSM 70294 / BCRC 21397 / CBS 2163 / NBRC 10782 / NRRL Y-8283 / UCD 57-17) TaxID=436907 RepID=A7TF54_VANPO|nr:uncharacterized protein Kpol_2000p44 [Vanderwaltozyma polyspora DSM 70294]EDO19079.1 hypothetical protein Kpol_2000p44 [Vanderwaltozyma polyspora DSM 70294]